MDENSSDAQIVTEDDGIVYDGVEMMDYREWPPLSGRFVKCVKGEVIETVTSEKVLEWREVPVSTAEGSIEGNEDGASARR